MGGELRDQNFLSHWDRESRSFLASYMRQALADKTPLCLASIGATEDCLMIEIETVLMPISFGGHEAERFFGVAHAVGDVYALAGRAVQFERLVAADFIDEGVIKAASPPPPSPGGPLSGGLRHRAPHLTLVSSRDEKPPRGRTLAMTESMRDLFSAFGARPDQKPENSGEGRLAPRAVPQPRLRIVVDDVVLQLALFFHPLQIGKLVAFESVAKGLELGLVFGRARVAAFGIVMPGLLAPHVEIERLHPVGSSGRPPPLRAPTPPPDRTPPATA